MFTLVKEPVVWADIEWPGLDEDGFAITNQIRMKVALLPLSEMQTTFGGEGEEATAEVIKRLARDWTGVVGEDGKLLPMTPANIDLMAEHVPNFARGFQASYLRAWLGQGKEREKNSEGSPDAGRAGGEATEPTQAQPSS